MPEGIASLEAASIIGLVSDTHGWLHPALGRYLAGADVILHAGDIGNGVLEALHDLAPVVAVRGNNDHGPEWATLPERVIAPCQDGWTVDLHHIAGREPAHPGARLLTVTGHSHVPAADTGPSRLHLNPGAAGRRRFRTVPTAGRVTMRPGGLVWEVRRLDDGVIVLQGSVA